MDEGSGRTAFTRKGPAETSRSSRHSGKSTPPPSASRALRWWKGVPVSYEITSDVVTEPVPWIILAIGFVGRLGYSSCRRRRTSRAETCW